MGIVFTIGGGEFTRREIDRLDKYSIELTGKSNPNLLYIPTASNDEEMDLYDDYFKELGCNIDKLALISSRPTDEEIDEKFDKADIIFAGGGDAILLMKAWKKYRLDKRVRHLYNHSNKVFSGISAGSICYYELGHTDSLSYHYENWDYERMHGTGLIPGINSPHYNEHRHKSLMRWIVDETLPGVGLDNCCALCCIDGKYTVITSDKDAKCHIIRNENGIAKEELYLDGESVKLI